MKTKLLCLLFALATHTALAEALKPLEQQSQAAHMAAVVLSRFHYKAMPLDDALSKKILDNYLKALDSDKVFFTKADVDQLASVATELDDAIIDGNLSIPFAISNLHVQRMSERFAYARSLLEAGFDFTQHESHQYERKAKTWPESAREIDELWRKRVKNEWLLLKLAGKTDDVISETLAKRYETSQKRIARISSEEAFQSFMNAYTTTMDPHSNYLGPRAAADFDISISLSLFGIGAVLAQQEDYTTVRELVPGGPARLSGQLDVGDRIVAVGQGDQGEITDVVGWRLTDVVTLIRGAADSTVRLVVLPATATPDGPHKFVPLVRKKITLDDQTARTTVLAVNAANPSEDRGGGKDADKGAGVTRHVGVITLPSFYRDFDARQKGDQEFRSAARDVAHAVAELKRQKVDAVLIDLRNNGGGSLIEAVETASLFVGSGPIVQQRDAYGEIKVQAAGASELAWDGPLGVLINRGSASASEIFAAAVQDYRRGLVIGEPSFGKGTVQALISLDDLARKDKAELGELKVTVAQFFRVNGGTTQRRGVKPDIALLAPSDPADYGEAAFDNALPWVAIKPLVYSPAGDLKGLLPILERRHQARIKTSKDFQNLQENLAELKRLRDHNVISLNEAERRREYDALALRLKSRQARTDAAGAVPVLDGHPPHAPDADDTANGTGHGADKNVKDISLIEAAHILGDQVELLTTGTQLAALARPMSKRDRGKSKRSEPAGRAGSWQQAQRLERGLSESP